MSKRILVTGSQGFVGKHVRAALTARGIETVGVDVSGSGAEHEIDLGADGFDAAPLASAAGKVDGVIYLAARITRGSSVDAAARANLRTIAEAPIKLLEALQGMSGPPHLVYCSTFKTYGPASAQPIDPLAPPQRPDPHSYGSAKALAERFLAIGSRRLDATFAVVRPTCIYGPGQHLHNAIPLFLRACLRGEPPTVFGTGSNRRDDVLVSDLAYCLVEASLRKERGAFHAGGERGRTILDVAELCCQAIAAIRGGAALRPTVDATRPPKWWLDQIFDIERTRERLAYEPTPLLEGLKQEARWLDAGADPQATVDFSPVRRAE
jgi:UDP-glucose 4-epimerase